MKKRYRIPFGYFILIGLYAILVFGSLRVILDSDDAVADNNVYVTAQPFVTHPPIETLRPTPYVATPAPTVEPTAPPPVETDTPNPLDGFTYHTFGNEILLNGYNGNDKVLEILPSYTVDGIEYSTNLSEFTDLGYATKSVIFPEGTTEIHMGLLSSVNSIYLPKSMTLVYDECLADMQSPSNGKKMVFYAGTEAEWNKVFTVLEVEAPDPNDPSYQLEVGVGEWFMGLFGMEDLGKPIIDYSYTKHYDASEFAYYFSASPSDLYAFN